MFLSPVLNFPIIKFQTRTIFLYQLQAKIKKLLGGENEKLNSISQKYNLCFNKSREENWRKDRAGDRSKEIRDGGSASPLRLVFRRVIKTCTVTKMPPMENALLRTASYFKRTGLVAVLYLLFSATPKSLTASSCVVLAILVLRISSPRPPSIIHSSQYSSNLHPFLSIFLQRAFIFARYRTYIVHHFR